jgi:hypothetical protein
MALTILPIYGIPLLVALSGHRARRDTPAARPAIGAHRALGARI